MKITYLLDRPALCGGVKVVFQHAELLRLMGHTVTILGFGEIPKWIRTSCRYLNYEKVSPQLERQDLVIATYWTTVSIAESLAAGPVAHFCQGYEGDLAWQWKSKNEIEAVYEKCLPTLVVTPHLSLMLKERFNRQCSLAPPPIDQHFRPAIRFGPRRTPWILVSGIFEAKEKGVITALQAIAKLKDKGVACRLLRISTWPLSKTESAILAPDRYLQSVSPQEVADATRTCDLALFPSHRLEGFGLPCLEAMASKVPVVASRIPSTEFIGQDELIMVSDDDVNGFAHHAQELLSNRHLWRRARRQGYKAAQKFHPRRVAGQVEESILWAQSSSTNQVPAEIY